MELDKLDLLLDQAPVILNGTHPVSLAFLREIPVIYNTADELIVALDSEKPTPRQRAVILNPSSTRPGAYRFPVVTVQHNPFTPALNRVLFENYDFISLHILSQTQVAQRIVETSKQVQTVILVLLDGLSYSDCCDWPGAEPCLASLPTITRICFPAIVGMPSVAERLYAVGFTHRVGFTYWSRSSEPLTKRLFGAIPDTYQIDAGRPNTFEQVLDYLEDNDLSATYVQIVRSALDDFAEGHRTTIPRQAILSHIRRDLDRILDILERKGQPALLFAISDHGILWKEDCHSIERVEITGARYVEARGGDGHGRCVEADGRYYWVLDYPQMGRDWKRNEQGTHGGISFEESIVPFIQLGVRLPC